jgi:hypothetical protein
MPPVSRWLATGMHVDRTVRMRRTASLPAAEPSLSSRRLRTALQRRRRRPDLPRPRLAWCGSAPVHTLEHRTDTHALTTSTAEAPRPRESRNTLAHFLRAGRGTEDASVSHGTLPDRSGTPLSGAPTGLHSLQACPSPQGNDTELCVDLISDRSVPVDGHSTCHPPRHARTRRSPRRPGTRRVYGAERALMLK